MSDIDESEADEIEEFGLRVEILAYVLSIFKPNGFKVILHDDSDLEVEKPDDGPRQLVGPDGDVMETWPAGRYRVFHDRDAARQFIEESPVGEHLRLEGCYVMDQLQMDEIGEQSEFERFDVRPIRGDGTDEEASSE